MVTGLRALAGGEPKGECELHLTWATDSGACDSDGDKALWSGDDVAILDDVRRVFIMARDMPATAG